VPDHRLDALAEMSKSKSVVPATVQFVDIGGLVAGASKGEGLGNKFLSHIREVDAIVFVLRAFEDDDVPGPSDPIEHLGIVELELTYADLETVENQIEKRRRTAKGDKSLLDEVAALDVAKGFLEAGTPLYRAPLKDEERRLLKGYFLLTNRPVMALVNVSEDQLDDMESVVAPVRAELDGKAEVIGMCVQLEAEAAMLDADERAEMLEGLGLGEGALPRFLHTAYQLLGLRTFLTTGEKESRAWTFRAGYKAPQCAGVIHGDFERGFIRAEVIRWDELLELGSWNKAKEVGKLRVEGKDYVVADGDVMEIRFNV
jgi:GTP-binding protein YchF